MTLQERVQKIIEKNIYVKDYSGDKQFYLLQEYDTKNIDVATDKIFEEIKKEIGRCLK